MKRMVCKFTVQCSVKEFVFCLFWQVLGDNVIKMNETQAVKTRAQSTVNKYIFILKRLGWSIYTLSSLENAHGDIFY